MAGAHGGARKGAGAKKGSRQLKTKVWFSSKLNAFVMEDGARLFQSSLEKLLKSDDLADVKYGMSIFLGVVEYFAPKLSRAEVTGQDGGPVETKSIVEFIDGT